MSGIDRYVETVSEELKTLSDLGVSGEICFRFALRDGGVRKCSIEIKRDLTTGGRNGRDQAQQAKHTDTDG